MKTWLKGGLWGLGISIIGILGYFLGQTIPAFGFLAYLNMPNAFLISLLYLGRMSLDILYVGILTAPITYFLIGALIGWVIKKIKSK